MLQYAYAWGILRMSDFRVGPKGRVPSQPEALSVNTMEGFHHKLIGVENIQCETVHETNTPGMI